MQRQSWRQSFGLIALFVFLGTVADRSMADTRQRLPVAIVEASPEIARHLEAKDGQLRVGGSEVWTALRRFHVSIVENPDLDLATKTNLPAGAALLLQLELDKIEIGINALPDFSALAKLSPGIPSLPESVVPAQPYYPYYIGIRLNARVRTPGATDYADNLGGGFFPSQGVTEKPDAKAKTQALVASLHQIDGSLNGLLGIRMLSVGVGPEGKPTFHVTVKNVYPFPVAGIVRFPTADEYRVDIGQRPFRLEPGTAQVLKFQLAAAEPQAKFVFPQWWTRKVNGTRDQELDKDVQWVGSRVHFRTDPTRAGREQLV